MRAANPEPFADGTPENPFTMQPSPVEMQCFKYCKCNKCGTVAECTPGFDFYASKAGDPLHCERCHFSRICTDIAKGKRNPDVD